MCFFVFFESVLAGRCVFSLLFAAVLFPTRVGVGGDRDVDVEGERGREDATQFLVEVLARSMCWNEG